MKRNGRAVSFGMLWRKNRRWKRDDGIFDRADLGSTHEYTRRV